MKRIETRVGAAEVVAGEGRFTGGGVVATGVVVVGKRVETRLGVLDDGDARVGDVGALAGAGEDHFSHVWRVCELVEGFGFLERGALLAVVVAVGVLSTEGLGGLSGDRGVVSAGLIVIGLVHSSLGAVFGLLELVLRGAFGKSSED